LERLLRRGGMALGGAAVMVIAWLVALHWRVQARTRSAHERAEELKWANDRLQREIAERKRAETALQRRAWYDELTGLPNRALLIERAKRSVEKASRPGTGGAGLLFLDMNSFKKINDRWGHHVGDHLLAAAARRLQEVVRAGDTCARFGGDEFCVLLEDLESEEQANGVIQRIHNTFERPVFQLAGEQFVIDFAIGAAYNWDGSETPEDLLARSDYQMYQGKSATSPARETDRPTERVPPELDPGLHRQVERALENDEFCLYYQPLVSLPGREFCGVEALLRWRQPDHSNLTAPDFLSILSNSATALVLHQWVLKQALSDFRTHFPSLHDGILNLNISAAQAAAPQWGRCTYDILAEYEFPCSHLVLDLTSGAELNQIERARLPLSELRDLGVSLSMDDFGLQEMSLRTFTQLGADWIKLNRSMLNLFEDGVPSQGLAGVIAGYAALSGASVVGENIETEGQALALAELGCIAAQGHYFGDPKPASELGALMREAGAAKAAPRWSRSSSE
jgi:diguanylate cyclase (GGDEF)-like protein